MFPVNGWAWLRCPLDSQTQCQMLPTHDSGSFAHVSMLSEEAALKICIHFSRGVIIISSYGNHCRIHLWWVPGSQNYTEHTSHHSCHFQFYIGNHPHKSTVASVLKTYFPASMPLTSEEFEMLANDIFTCCPAKLHLRMHNRRFHSGLGISLHVCSWYCKKIIMFSLIYVGLLYML